MCNRLIFLEKRAGFLRIFPPPPQKNLHNLSGAIALVLKTVIFEQPPFFQQHALFCFDLTSVLIAVQNPDYTKVPNSQIFCLGFDEQKLRSADLENVPKFVILPSFSSLSFFVSLPCKGTLRIFPMSSTYCFVIVGPQPSIRTFYLVG